MVTKLDPQNYEAWFDCGETLFELGYHRQALKALDRSIELNGTWADAFLTRARAQFALHQVDEAVESLKRCFQLDPEKRKEFEKEFPEIPSLGNLASLLKR
jgi:tetratricopeptide (TPR) repeat protein